MRDGPGWAARIVALVLFLASLGLYVATLCPDLYWFDCAEFVNDAVLTDIPHPPGYPLYNLLAHAFTWLPFGTLAARVNLLSAVVSALTVAAVFLAGAATGAPLPIAAGFAVLFGVSDQFWDLSTVAEVYGLEALAIALALWCIARIESDDEPVSGRRAAPLAVLMGVALFHRPTALFFLAGWIGMLWKRLQRPKTFLLTMGVGALPYLHTAWVFFTRESVAPGMPWSMNYFDFPRTVETFLRICTGTLYAGNLSLLAPGELANEVVAYLVLAREQLSAVVLAAAALSLLRLARPGAPRISKYLGVLAVANVGFFLFYNALEKDTMYVPSFLALTLLALQATRELWERPHAQRAVALGLAVVATYLFTLNAPRMDRHAYHEVRRAVDSTARLLPERAWLYLTDDLIIHPFLHVMILEGVRRDVQVQIVDGFGEAVKNGIQARLARREAVFSTLFYPEEIFREVAKSFSLTPRGFLYEIRQSPPRALPSQSGSPGKLDTGGVKLLGASLFPAGRPVRRSDQIQAVVTWDLGQARDPAAVFRYQPPGATAPLTWVHRIGYQGRPRAGTQLTEEYLLKVPWNFDPRAAGAASLDLAIVPSIEEAVKASTLSLGNVRDWNERVFFKSSAGGFIRAIERGWPVYAEVLSIGQKAHTLDAVSLGPVELAREAE